MTEGQACQPKCSCEFFSRYAGGVPTYRTWERSQVFQCFTPIHKTVSAHHNVSRLGEWRSHPQHGWRERKHQACADEVIR